MQNACPLNKPVPQPMPAARLWLVGLVLATVAVATEAARPAPVARVAALAPAQTAPVAAGQAQAAAALPDQAARWLAQQLQIPADKITVQAPDPRMRMPLCSSGVKFDTPFSNANTVRARCDTPAWQLFMRASWSEDAVGAPSGSLSNLAARPANGSGGLGGATPSSSPSTPSTTRAGAADPLNRATNEARRGVMLTRSVPRGALLSPASVEFTPVPAREADNLLIADAQALEQVEAVRDLPAGVPLRHTDVRPAVLVRQGQWVTMTVGQGTGFVVTVRLEALQDGRMGDRVMLRNAESGRTVSGVVTGLNSVKGA